MVGTKEVLEEAKCNKKDEKIVEEKQNVKMIKA